MSYHVVLFVAHAFNKLYLIFTSVQFCSKGPPSAGPPTTTMMRSPPGKLKSRPWNCIRRLGNTRFVIPDVVVFTPFLETEA